MVSNGMFGPDRKGKSKQLIDSDFLSCYPVGQSQKSIGWILSLRVFSGIRFGTARNILQSVNSNFFLVLAAGREFGSCNDDDDCGVPSWVTIA